MPKLSFERGITHYDLPPPAVIDDLEALRAADAFRFANELRAWIDVEDGRVVRHGQDGGGLIGATRVTLGWRDVVFAATAFPDLRPEPEVSETSVRFAQTAGGRTALPAPRLRGRRLPRVDAPIAWTTLALTVHADGSSERELAGASSFPRHWLYDADGRLCAKSGLIDFRTWWHDAFEPNTPWGSHDAPAVVAQVESALERELSTFILREGAPPSRRRRVEPGQILCRQGEPGDEVFLLLDGLLVAEVDDEAVSEFGPGAILGERACLEGGVRTATLRARTPCRVVVVRGDELNPDALAELARTRR